MTNEATLSWLDESKRFLRKLADSASTGLHTRGIGSPEVQATTDDVRITLRSMQHWISANPCPDGAVRTQLQVVAGRYGFLALVLETSDEGLGKEELVTLGARLDEVNVRLLALIAEVERGLEGDDAVHTHD